MFTQYVFFGKGRYCGQFPTCEDRIIIDLANIYLTILGVSYDFQ